jgi:hypothetical protein
MNDIYVSREYGITAFHVLYPIKYLLLTKKTMTSVGKDKDGKYRKIPFITALFMLLLIGEGGGIICKILAGSKVSLLENDFKFHVAIALWLLMNYVLPSSAVSFVILWLNNAPFNFIFILPNEFRRGMALCSSILLYRSQFGETSWIIPIIIGTLTTCMGTFTFPLLRYEILLNHEERLKEHEQLAAMRREGKKPASVLDFLPTRVIIPLICAFLYTILLDLGYKSFYIWNIEMSMRLAISLVFVAEPLYQFISANLSKRMSKLNMTLFDVVKVKEH